MRKKIETLGNLYQSCSTHLFKNLAQRGIAYWWDKTDLPKGGVAFFYYDSISACLRLMPKAPRFFSASVKSGIVGPADAHLLSRELLKTSHQMLERYSGCFADELKTGIIGESIRRGADPDDLDLHDAHQALTPDDIFANLPWPLIPSEHFKDAQSAPAGLRSNYIAEASREPLRATNTAAEVTVFGPSFLPDASHTIQQILAVLRGEPGTTTAIASEDHVQKLIIPCFVSGFQGIAFGVFQRLPGRLEQFVASQLQQFCATVGENVAALRAEACKTALRNATGLWDYAQAFLGLLPPMEHFICVRGKEKVGLRLIREGSYLGGYRKKNSADIDQALAGQQNHRLNPLDADAQVYAQLASGFENLSSTFTILRMRPRIDSMPMLSADNMEPLTQAELNAIHAGLRRQIKQSRGAIAATKKLFLIENVLQYYERKEITLSNSMAKEFVERTLGRSVTGYHVTGKAAKKFEIDAQKLAPKRFSFQRLSTSAIKVRWRTGERAAPT
jgi:hypothetical protein